MAVAQVGRMVQQQPSLTSGEPLLAATSGSMAKAMEGVRSGHPYSNISCGTMPLVIAEDNKALITIMATGRSTALTACAAYPWHLYRLALSVTIQQSLHHHHPCVDDQSSC